MADSGFPPDGPPVNSMRLSRRRLLTGAATLGAALALTPIGSAGAQSHRRPDPLSSPAQSGIEHIVLVMMENRSFDHFLGWLPRADGRQAGLSYTDSSGARHMTYHLRDDQGCAHPDPDHSYEGGRVEYDGGRCDGWLRAGSNDVYAIGYYTDRDLSFLGQAAPAWTTCDQYFAAIMAETYPNRIYQHAAQTDRIHNSETPSTLPTIWDRLSDAGLSGLYYYSDIPFLALWGAKYVSIGRPFAAFLSDCAAGTLPQVAYVDPRFEDESSGTSGDDHPHADIRVGESFLSRVYTAVTRSPAWPKTVLVINYDEWGGFFEHVVPTAAPIPPADQLAGNKDGLRGFRVPCLVISPFAPRHTVAHTLYDHTSVLALIEWRFGLAPLTVRDQTANNLATALDFSRPSLTAPLYEVPTTVPLPCAAGSPTTGEEWTTIAALAQQYGWPLYPTA